MPASNDGHGYSFSTATKAGHDAAPCVGSHCRGLADRYCVPVIARTRTPASAYGIGCRPFPLDAELVHEAFRVPLPICAILMIRSRPAVDQSKAKSRLGALGGPHLSLEWSAPPADVRGWYQLGQAIRIMTHA
jgi:hypothetical protein